MRPPTGNEISQKKHGQFNAVDYHSTPDPVFYAPERVTFHAYLLNAGDAGNNLQVIGANGRHGFCHLEASFIRPGQTVEKGEPLGRMGYTGLTRPSGPDGRHLHWVLLKNGIYVYPPDYITEPFEEEDMERIEELEDLANFRQGLLNKIGAAVSVKAPVDGSNIDNVIGNIKELERLINEKDNRYDALVASESDDAELGRRFRELINESKE